jgi:hypothetical protein
MTWCPTSLWTGQVRHSSAWLLQDVATGWIAGRMEDVPLQLAPEELEAMPWRVEALSTLIDAVRGTRPGEWWPAVRSS